MNTEIFNVQEDQASSFLDQFLAGEKIEIAQEQSQQKPVVEDTSETTIEETEEKPGTEDEAAQNLVKDKGQKEEKKEDVPEKLFDKLHEQGLIFPYEDGTKPQTFEEIADALKQSSEVTINDRIQEVWESKITALPPSIQTIIKYAESGVTTATEINELIKDVSHFEKVSELDPKNEQHQEQIVFLHLLNTGLSEEEARGQIEIFKESKILERTADKFYPLLKRMYENQIRQDFQNKEAREEDLSRYIQTNAVNTSYFLKDEQTFLPFKISKNHKAAVMELAAKPLGVNDKYEPVFAYQDYLKRLQDGTEEQYKEFMEIMTFIADRKEYKAKLSSGAVTKTSKDNFKKVAMGEGKITNKDSMQDEYQGPVIRKKTSTPWSI